jgi:hypothetical protein
VSLSDDGSHNKLKHPEMNTYAALEVLRCTQHVSLNMRSVSLLLHLLGSVS